MARIDRHFQQLYRWNFEQPDPHSVQVTIEFPSDFSPNSMTYELNDEKTVFQAYFDKLMPVINGTLFEQVQSYTTQVEKDHILITFQKESETKWDCLIKARNPTTDSVDPHSAFDIFLHLATHLDENSEEAERYLQFSMLSGYTPAMLYGIEILEDDPSKQGFVRDLISVAAIEYGEPAAVFRFALILIQEGKTQNGVQLLSYAARAGIGIAYSLMGQVLSPLSSIEYSEKNAAEAMKCFELVLAQKDEPIALFEAAKLLNAGLGCQKDTEKANDYSRRAKAIEPEKLPDKLPEYKPPSKDFKIFGIPVFAAAGAATALIAAGSLLSLYFRNRKN
ncbi:hypothetical protein TVAG_237530 [Trichomonas vaginalis G3]|uniref:CS domain-containing protein n=1 Tax=Trichomonas vaginalis (strain ATCC PRA-98 / G3) TaxID=412133 RepID=A2DCV3_TRIV3|nr:HCP-like family [Trichomonas vaginalis G3]EAY21727.1 hypothetical protein TVAG_237530 [Trichomonas vaginalis G3]KAI5524300.1 HCP-like family [Trichomonas vaginalis G3]|eukprot:XP_001582713.1 hypothetical protein [Trichomonas vaginalis G3]